MLMRARTDTAARGGGGDAAAPGTFYSYASQGAPPPPPPAYPPPGVWGNLPQQRQAPASSDAYAWGMPASGVPQQPGQSLIAGPTYRAEVQQQLYRQRSAELMRQQEDLPPTAWVAPARRVPPPLPPR